MYINVLSRNGIGRLPKMSRRVALWLRRVLIVAKSSARRETYSEKDIRARLSMGIEYIRWAEVTGDVAEFGTMSGRTASIMSMALSKFDTEARKSRKIHLFDSFEGLPQAQSAVDMDSPYVKSGVWGVGTCIGITKDELRSMCGRFLSRERIVIYEGWFKDTLPRILDDVKFAMVHIDCDMYQSTIEVLTYLFKNRHISEGSALFFDDYSCNKASPEFGERRAWEEAVNNFSVVFSDCGEYGWSGRKFIVHNYKGMA